MLEKAHQEEQERQEPDRCCKGRADGRKKMDFIRGMDVSSYFEMKDKGYHYYDEENHEVDVLEYAVKRGFNYARLRIWKEPERFPESGGYCNLEQTIKLAQKIKSLGIGYVLDFHYSDWWADPGNQKKPAAWEGLSVDGLEEAVYQYTKECLETLDAAGAYPDMVQIGNEIRTGMLFPEGAVPEWENLARFINAGIRGVRETQGVRDTRIILHLDQGGKHEYFREWFDHVMEHGVKDFDIIGLSYYPFWHGQYHELKNNMDALAERYGKELLVMETAHAFRRSGGKFFREEQERAAGFPATQEAQRRVLELIISIIFHAKEQKGLGFFYWEPFTRAAEDAAGWGTCMSLMDEAGRPTEGYRAISYEPWKEEPKRIAKIYCGEEIGRITRKNLPSNVRVLYMDGTLEEKAVEWETGEGPGRGMAGEEEDNEGQAAVTAGGDSTEVLTGQIADVPEEWSRITLTLSEESQAKNLVRNGDFAEGMEGFTLTYEKEHTEYGINARGFWYKAAKNFHLELISDEIPVKAETTYRASLIYRGGNTTGTKIKFFARGKGEAFPEGEISCEVFPEEAAANCYQLKLPAGREQQIAVGVEICAPPVSGEIQEIRLEEYCRE